MISVTISNAADDCAGQWDDLVRRASPNVFMDPAALDAVRTTHFADLRVLSAWKLEGETRRLVGLWALQVRRIAPFWPLVLEALPYEYAFLSNPVIDLSFLDAVVLAFFAAVRACRTLPCVISLRSLDTEAPSYAAMQRSLAAQGGSERQVASDARPVATQAAGIKRGGSTRKKLRQDWNRFCTLGTVDVTNSRTAEAVCDAFETFLRLERASWKGERGTALLCDRADAAFARQLFANLAAHGHASVALLRIDGRAVAAQVLMYCGSTAYTWKTAYDPGYGRFSPGILLVDKVTEQLFASGEITIIDSCALESSFMAQVWSGRRATADILIDLSGRSPAFRIEVIRRRGVAVLKKLRNRFRTVRRGQRPRHPLSLGTTQPIEPTITG